MTTTITDAELGKLKRALRWLKGFGEGSSYVGVINRTSEIESVVEAVEKRGEDHASADSPNDPIFTPEQLARINGDHALLSLLYDLNLLPEVVLSRIRHAREEEREACARVADVAAAFCMANAKGRPPDRYTACWTARADEADLTAKKIRGRNASQEGR